MQIKIYFLRKFYRHHNTSVRGRRSKGKGKGIRRPFLYPSRTPPYNTKIGNKLVLDGLRIL